MSRGRIVIPGQARPRVPNKRDLAAGIVQAHNGIAQLRGVLSNATDRVHWLAAVGALGIRTGLWTEEELVAEMLHQREVARAELEADPKAEARSLPLRIMSGRAYPPAPAEEEPEVEEEAADA